MIRATRSTRARTPPMAGSAADQQTMRRLYARLPIRGLSLVVFAVLLGGSLTASGFARRVMADQEHRMLKQRAGEAAALLTNVITQSQASTRALAAVALATDGDPDVFLRRRRPRSGAVQRCGRPGPGRRRPLPDCRRRRNRPRRRPGAERGSRRHRPPGPGHRELRRHRRLRRAGRGTTARSGPAGRRRPRQPRHLPRVASSDRPACAASSPPRAPSARSKRCSTPARRPMPTRSSWPPGPCRSRAAPSTTSSRSAPTGGSWWWRPTVR